MRDAAFNKAMHEMVFGGGFRALGPYTATVYMCVGVCADADTGLSRPNIKTLAHLSSISEREVRKSLVRLEKGGWIERAGKAGRSTVFRLVERTMTDTGNEPHD